MTEGVSKEEQFDVLVPKQGTIKDIISGLQKKANIDDETIRNVRIYESHANKFHKTYHEESGIVSISEFVTLYAEIIPEEERENVDGETMMSCYHFDKEPNKVHGVPFVFVVKPGEKFIDTKERLSKRIGLKGKQFEKIKFAIIQRSLYAKPTYLTDTDVLSEYASNQEDHLGIDHVNRNKGLAGKGDSIFIR